MKCRIRAVGFEVRGGLDPSCSDVCPSEALKVRNDGSVEVVLNDCLACLACMAICGPDRIRIIVDWFCPTESGGAS